jgi:hypothetical protein
VHHQDKDDFIINDNYVFEIGGTSKNAAQLKEIKMVM